MAKMNWDEAIKHYEKGLEIATSLENQYQIAGDYISIGKARFKKEEVYQAIESYKKAAEIAVKAGTVFCMYTFQESLNGLEIACRTAEKIQEFKEFCDCIRTEYANTIKELPFHQWYLEPAEPSSEFSHLAFSEDFLSEDSIDPSWVQIKEYDDCKFKITENGGLEINSANRRDLVKVDLTAPRIIRKIWGDFSVVVNVSKFWKIY